MKIDSIAYLHMPFGKYRGQMVDDLPTDYLAWLKDRDLREPIKSAVEYVYGLRINPPQPPAPSLPFDVDSWYRKLSLEFHPDRRNGSCEGMKAIQRAKELAEELIRKT